MEATAILARQPRAQMTVPTSIRVLEADPDLGDGVDERESDIARARSVATVFAFDPGPWCFFPEPEVGALGALLLDGLILVRVGIGSRSHAELLGGGDVISPWVSAGPDIMVPPVVSARIVSRVSIALLDRAFAQRIRRWPEIHAGLMRRLVLRSRALSTQSAINTLPRIEHRLELTLWHLANRFGRVGPHGVKLELPITHGHLAEILAARRPSVTMAIARLEERGRLVRIARRRWLLCGRPPSELAVLSCQSGLAV